MSARTNAAGRALGRALVTVTLNGAEDRAAIATLVLTQATDDEVIVAVSHLARLTAMTLTVLAQHAGGDPVETWERWAAELDADDHAEA